MLMSASAKIAFTIAGVLGFVFCLLGGVLFTYYPRIIQKKIQESMMLTETSDSFKSFMNSPVPVYMRFYMFNVTNPQEVNDHYKKPNLMEVGPFTFKVIRLKEKVNWRTQTGQLDFVLRKQYVFQRDLSSGDMNELIYTLNVPYIGVGTFLKHRFTPDIRAFVYPDLSDKLAEQNVKLIEPHRVREMLFEGYHVKLLDFLTEYAEGFGMKVPPVLPNNTFGLFYGKNNTVEGDFLIGTGTKSAKDINRIFQFNNSSSLTYWGSTYCNMINGTDGSSFSPGVKKTDRLHVFSADLCRSLHLDYEKPVEVQGIPSLRFSAMESVFGDGKTYKENMCYCTTPERCTKAGVLSLASCRGGSPVAASAPHFFSGAREYVDAFGGLNPEKSKHETYVDVEQRTGLVMRAARRVQLNIDVQKQEGLYIFDNLTDIMFPIAWIHEELKTYNFAIGPFVIQWLFSPVTTFLGAELDADTAAKFKSKVMTPVVVGEALILGAIVLGAIALVVSLSSAVYFVSKQRTMVGSSSEILHYK